MITGAPLRLQREDGSEINLPIERWKSDAQEWEALDRVVAPVLDVGCGPGRHALALGRRGMVALGVDVVPAAVRMAVARGAMALERSIFERLPGAGRWRSALLLDGNIGIGGQPEILLRRLRDLLNERGRIVAELEAPGVDTRGARARILGEGYEGPWFDWSLVGCDQIQEIAAGAGFCVTETWVAEDRRFFACLDAA
jgi:SAM-dependent methyltransferase